MNYSTNFGLKLPQRGVEMANINDLNDNTEDIDTIMYQNRTMLAPPYDPSETYNSGNRVVQLGEYYICNTDNTTGPWDATYWDKTTIGEDIEANAGGGGGSSTLAGLSDVSLTSPSQGQALVYDGTDWVNGNSVGGGGMFIDTSNVLVATTSYSGSFSYTATQDCCIVFNFANAVNASGYATLDGKEIAGFFSSAVSQQTVSLMMKKGQVISVITSYTQASVQYTVYGLTYTTQSLQPVIYSTDEREVGVWTDGKPLWQKTVTLGTAVSIPYNTWTTFCSWAESIEIKDCCGIASGGDVYPNLSASYDNGDVQVLNVRNMTISLVTLTIQYTKTTDTAGSGTWTPSGVPAVHYSTQEQVVGTWIDGSNLYEITIEATSPSTANIDTTIETLTDLNYGQIISIEGILYAQSLSQYIPIFWSYGTSLMGSVYVEGNNLKQELTNANYLNCPVWVTLRYTKSS